MKPAGAIRRTLRRATGVVLLLVTLLVIGLFVWSLFPPRYVVQWTDVNDGGAQGPQLLNLQSYRQEYTAFLAEGSMVVCRSAPLFGPVEQRSVWEWVKLRSAEKVLQPFLFGGSMVRSHVKIHGVEFEEHVVWGVVWDSTLLVHSSGIRSGGGRSEPFNGSFIATPGLEDAYALHLGWPLALLLVLSLWWWHVPRRLRAMWRRRHGRCEACGYDLRGSASTTCSECGATIATPHEARPLQRP